MQSQCAEAAECQFCVLVACHNYLIRVKMFSAHIIRAMWERIDRNHELLQLCLKLAGSFLSSIIKPTGEIVVVTSMSQMSEHMSSTMHSLPQATKNVSQQSSEDSYK